MAIECNRLRQPLKIATAVLVGGFLDDLLMSSRIAFSLFRWLIFVSTLCDP
jgi:hypothetical protein